MKVIWELPLVFFSCWTLSYQIVFVARWPSYYSLIVFAMMAMPSLAFWTLLRRRYAWQDLFPDEDRLSLTIVCLFGLLAAFLSTIISRPDADDIGYFHRVLSQIGHIEQPFIVEDMSHNIQGLPGMPSTHLITSYEMLLGFFGWLLHLDPLSLYQNFSCGAACFFLPVVYFFLFRELGLRPYVAVAAVIGIVVFLLVDGNLHKSFGNFAFVRLWQGKAILMTVLMPLTFLLCMRFFWNPTWYTWITLFMVNICSVGLSGMGLFFMPAFVFVSSVALFFSAVCSNERSGASSARRTLLLNLTSIYPVVVVALLAYDIFPSSYSLSIAHAYVSDTVSGSWRDSVWSVVGSPWRMVWYVSLLIFTPLLALENPGKLTVLFLSITSAALFLNPWLGPFWMKAFNVVYWRFVYLLPVTLCAGLLFSLLYTFTERDWKTSATWANLGLFVLMMAFFYLQFRQTTLSPGNGVSIKNPLDYKLPRIEKAFSKRVGPMLHDKSVLAPEALVVSLSLVAPNIRWEAQRQMSTQFFFSVSGDEREGRRRNLAQSVVSCAGNSPESYTAFSDSLRQGVNAVITLNSCLEQVHPLFPADSWGVLYQDSTYSVYVKR